jgi:arylsulfatase
VSPDYRPLFAFSGTIHKITVDLSGDLILDDEATARMLLARQ